MAYQMTDRTSPLFPRFLGTYDTIEAALEAVPGGVAYHEVDAEHDAADVFSSTGVVYAIEPVL